MSTPVNSNVTLPKSLIVSETKSPRNLVLFSKPKTGKTTLLSKLENCLIIDLEDGSDYVDALKIKAHSVEDIIAIGQEIKKQGKPYEYVAIDTITKLEDYCIPLAEKIYMNTPMGSNWNVPETGGKAKYGNILNLPNGAGYAYLRQAVEKMLAFINTLANKIILVAHVKEVLLEKSGSEFSSLDLDLTGKIKRSVASDSDAIGYLYRKGKKNILSFKTSDEVSCGTRARHLSNKEIVISEVLEDGSYVTRWEEIYVD